MGEVGTPIRGGVCPKCVYVVWTKLIGGWGQVKINVVWILENGGVICAFLGVEGRDGT